MAISDLQNGQVLVVGAAGSSGRLPRLAALFIILISVNSTMAIIRKLITAVIKEPYLMLTPNTDNTKSLKSVFATRPISGEIMSSVREVTMFWNAAPMITPTARSMTFPRRANALNYSISFFMF